MLQVEDYPQVTFALFAFNQEKYIREALEGAFAQTYSPLEIILSDDCSTDRTFEIMQEMVARYQGPHQVIIRQQITNLGLARGISDVCQMAKGQLIVAAAGDDISSPLRTQEIVRVWKKNGMGSGSLYSHFRMITADGALVPPKNREIERKITLHDRQLDMLNNFSGISGCAHAWTKDLFDMFGSIDARIDHEDVIIPLRALLVGSISFIPLDLVDYRLTAGSITRKSFASARERIKKMERYWRGKIAIFEQFKLDVELGLSKAWFRQHDVTWLIDETAKAEEYARLMQQLYASNTTARIKLICSRTSLMPLRQRAKWVAITLVPWVYRFRFPNLLRS